MKVSKYFIFVFMFFLSLSLYAQVVPTNEWVNFYGENTHVNGNLIPVGSVVQAFDPDGVLCGIDTVDNEGHYGFLLVYADDNTTPGTDEGASVGDRIVFTINSLPAKILGPDSSFWTGNGAVLNVELSANSAPVANFTADYTHGTAPLVVHFTDTSTGVISSWQWDFGDDSGDTVQNPVHTFNTAGTFSVSLTVTGPGGSDTKIVTNYITVTEAAPIANFSASVTTGTLPLSVQFNDNSTGTITTWLWDFGDDSNSSEQNPVHEYDTAGSYSVSLTVTGPGGADTKVMENYINVSEAAPVADFSASSTRGEIPFTVQFTDHSTGVIASWSWNFGDENTSDLQNPQHEYINEGKYTVSLTVTGPGGTDTKSIENYIEATLPDGINDQLVKIPMDNRLYDAYPNPFNPTTTISFDVKQPGYVKVVVFNALGNIVKEIVADYRAAGNYQIEWDASDTNGNSVSSGIYYVRMEVNDFTVNKKIMLVR